jgi:glycosyltransferase involved in cell wall biosynthesis
MQFHVLSFEGPDAYSRVGGIATRVEGLTETLAAAGNDTQLWFVGDPDQPGHEFRNSVQLHRWAQWVSRHHPGGVYDGELGKSAEFARSLPPYLTEEFLIPRVRQGRRAVVLAEEWQTVDAVFHLDYLLRTAGVRDRVSILWNANNTFGFERIPWDRLSAAAIITTVSRYMKHRMKPLGVDALVIPNGLSADAFEPPDGATLMEFRRRFWGRTLLTKVARWDPDKRWLEVVKIIVEMKKRKWRPLLIARGGTEPYGEEVLASAGAHGLRVIDGRSNGSGLKGMLAATQGVGDADIVNLRSHLDSKSRQTLFNGSSVVLANSGHEPFGLVGLEAMAAGGIACTGCSGEDYAVAGQNALVLETADPNEFVGLFEGMRTDPAQEMLLRHSARSTARRYRWKEVLSRVLLPRIDLLNSPAERYSR